MGLHRDELRLEPEDVPLSAFAEKLSGQVGEIAEKLEARLPAPEARGA